MLPCALLMRGTTHVSAGDWVLLDCTEGVSVGLHVSESSAGNIVTEVADHCTAYAIMPPVQFDSLSVLTHLDSKIFSC